MYREIFSGYNENPFDYLKAQFSNDHYDEKDIYKSAGMVIVKDIEFYSHCEHHMVPFFGSCNIGYIPNKTVVGISKIARVVQVFAKRLQIQERMTNQIADVIYNGINPQGVIVVVEAQHLCMKMRGVKNGTSSTVTSSLRGVFEKDSTRVEFFNLIK